VSTVEALWKHSQRENIAVVETERGDESSLKFVITLSLKSSRVASDGQH
jgi:hypothetical protein